MYWETKSLEERLSRCSLYERGNGKLSEKKYRERLCGFPNFGIGQNGLLETNETTDRWTEN